MTDGRLPAHVEVGGLRRAAEAAGGFATVLHKGDAERGSLLVQLVSGSATVALLERTLGADGRYGWRQATLKGGERASDWAEKRLRFDPDLWWIELDIADPQRFIVENGLVG